MINKGDALRVYDDKDWFDEGSVVGVNSDCIVVDFADWVQEYPIESIKETFIYYKRYLVSLHEGKTIKDYR